MVLGDFSIPIEIFERVRLNGQPAYDVRVCSASAEVDTRHARLQVPWRLSSLRTAHTVMIPGVDDICRPVAPAVIQAIRRAAERGARIASICSGAFVLAATGLLDGLHATTHWMAADELARRHPTIDVNPSVLYVDNGQILTSAGAAAGLDLCLYLVRRDFGARAAADAARAAVMPLERAGGQAQFVEHKPPAAEGESLQPVLRWIEGHLALDLSLPGLARQAKMSTRTFSRRFKEQTGATPAKWIAHARIRRAQQLLEETPLSVEQVAGEVGFGSATVLREQFKRIVGASPQAYRQAFAPPRSAS